MAGGRPGRGGRGFRLPGSRGRVVAVGTTSVRSLESAARDGELKPFSGDTDIFIYPGRPFHVVDALVTNFHLPESTLLMLVSAFAGYPETMAAYAAAVAQGYRFFSYGDAMFITRNPRPRTRGLIHELHELRAAGDRRQGRRGRLTFPAAWSRPRPSCRWAPTAR